ncbi:phage head morphogenesis protein [Vagococcus sp. JNUCC 83]
MSKKQKASEKYWNKRKELEDKIRLKMENKTLDYFNPIFQEAIKKIQEKLLSQADLHKITYEELMTDYSLRDQKRYREYIDKNYKELMNSDKKYQEFIDEFFPSYDYAKINRLLQLRSDIFNILANEAMSKDVNSKLKSDLEDIVKRMYNANSNLFMTLVGPGDFHVLSDKELKAILNYPWSGKTFSNRLWGNISRLEQSLTQSIVGSIQSGEGVLEAIKKMKHNSEIADMFKQDESKFKQAIENLVRTEYAHFAVEGLKKAADDAGIKDMQSWSAEDERVCDVCGDGPNGRHGKIIKDNWHPPYHTLCRCTEIPKMADISDDIDKMYEEMFGNLLDEFAMDKFGVKLNKK